MDCYCFYTTPIGKLYLSANHLGVKEIQLCPMAGQIPHPGKENRDFPHLQCTVKQLQRYFGGQSTPFTLPLTPTGTPFQKRVWQQLSRVTYGTSSTYGTVARSLALPRAARAIGQAIAANPLLIVIPCHRILSAQGELTGYRGGLVVKQTLLALEGISYRQGRTQVKNG